MPSEDPRLPRETYRTLLAQGGNKHMPLQAGEVGTIPRRRGNGTVRFLRAVVPSLIGVFIFYGIVLAALILL